MNRIIIKFVVIFHFRDLKNKHCKGMIDDDPLVYHLIDKLRSEEIKTKNRVKNTQNRNT